MSGNIKLPHTCPNCNDVTATTFQELDELFGLRNITEEDSESPKYFTNQSWCRECRKKSS